MHRGVAALVARRLPNKSRIKKRKWNVLGDGDVQENEIKAATRHASRVRPSSGAADLGESQRPEWWVELAHGRDEARRRLVLPPAACLGVCLTRSDPQGASPEARVGGVERRLKVLVKEDVVENLVVESAKGAGSKESTLSCAF